jgi:hypothetical protein
MVWDHFDAVELAKFLGKTVTEVKRMTPRELTVAVDREIARKAREKRAL